MAVGIEVYRRMRAGLQTKQPGAESSDLLPVQGLIQRKINRSYGGGTYGIAVEPFRPSNDILEQVQRCTVHNSTDRIAGVCPSVVWISLVHCLLLESLNNYVDCKLAEYKDLTGGAAV